MAFFHDSGDHSRESPSGKEEVELVGVRGVVDATLRLVFVDVVVDDVDGVKAAAPPTRLAAKITDNLIVYDMCMQWRPKVSMVVLQYYKSEIRSLDVDGFGFVVAINF